jgi:hypothetical protein
MRVEIAGLDQLNQRIAAMADNIAKFGSTDMPGELDAWQVEDMHRHYPQTDTPDDHTATTEIFPRSRVPSKHMKARKTGRLVPIALAKPRGTAGKTVVSVRPILRESLWKQLCERMDQLMEKCLSWASASRS